MLRFKYGLYLLVSIFLFSTCFANKPFEPDQFVAKSYQHGGAKSFPNNGQAQIQWFYKNDNFFLVSSNEDLTHLSRLGEGDILYMLDENGTYQYCFMLKSFHPTPDVGFCLIGDDPHSLTEVRALSREKMLLGIGSNGSRWTGNPKDNPITLNQTNETLTAEFKLPNYKWIYVRTETNGIKSMTTYKHELITDKKISFFPDIGVVTEPVAPTTDLMVYSLYKRMSLYPIKVKAVLSNSEINFPESIIGYEGTYKDTNKITHNIILLVGIHNSTGFLLILDTGSAKYPEVRSEFIKAVESFKFKS